jgi:SAM-dependent methyltransferase
VSLREAWESQAANWTAWARQAGHDSFQRGHADAFLELLPPPGHLTLDLGCGEGRLGRLLQARGHQVVALDGAPTLVRAAAEHEQHQPVILADMAALPFADGCADLVVAFMSLQDVDDMPSAVQEAARVLSPEGRLCLATVHPVNSAGSFVSKDADSPFVIEGSYFESVRYADDVERDGLKMTFHSDHHSLEAFARALEDAGLLIEAIREIPRPGSSWQWRPEDERWRRIPYFLHFRAVRK